MMPKKATAKEFCETYSLLSRCILMNGWNHLFGLLSAKLIRRPTTRHVDLLCIVVLCLLMVNFTTLLYQHKFEVHDGSPIERVPFLVYRWTQGPHQYVDPAEHKLKDWWRCPLGPFHCQSYKRSSHRRQKHRTPQGLYLYTNIFSASSTAELVTAVLSLSDRW